MTTNDTQLSNKELRDFGLIMGAMIAVVFGLLIPWLWGTALPLWPWIVAGVLWLWSLALPGSLTPVYRLWMKIAAVLGWINTRIIMGLAFYVIFLPTGATMRLFGKDPMTRRLDPDATSYRINKTPPPQDHMEKPF